MERELWIGLADVAPTEANAEEAFEDCAGAYVQALALADSADDFAARVGRALEGLELQLLELERAEPVRDRLRRESLADGLVARAIEAARDDSVELGTFHLYPWEDEEEPDLDRTLVEALESELLVRLETSTGWQEGFVVGLGEEWLLLHRLDLSVDLNGYAAIRLETLEGAELLSDDEYFAGPSLALRGIRPVPQPEIVLEDLPALLASIGRLAALVAVDRGEDGTVLGRVVHLDDESFLLRQVSVAGRWDESGGYRYEDVGRVSFGGRYDVALARVAGEPPA